MNDALYIAATGMQAQQAALDVIANNVANVNTTAFKRGRVSFADLVNRAAADDGTELASTAKASTAAQAAGVVIGAVSKQFSAGELRKSDDPMHLAIQGEGFLEVTLPDGSSAYMRGAGLVVNAEHLLATREGLALKQRVQVGNDLQQLAVAPDGQVTAKDDKGREWNLGRLELTMFANPTGLTPLGDNLYRAAGPAGEALVASPGESGAGRMALGFEEASNVKLVDEILQMMVAQRAYEMNVKVIQAADEIAGMVNNLRK